MNDKSNYVKVRDDVLGMSFDPISIRRCPHPEVIKRYGTGGKAYVSVLTCRKCKFHESVKWIGGSKCKYEESAEALNG